MDNANGVALRRCALQILRAVNRLAPHALIRTHISSLPQVPGSVARSHAIQVSIPKYFIGKLLSFQGAKSYCCKTEVKPWTNCAWYDKETDAFSHGICEASCPLDSILLGMQKGKCEKGESAYCCGGPASLPPPPPPPPVESPKVREFEDAVRV